MKSEKSLVIFKPDVVERGIVGELIQRFEHKGIKIVAMKMAWPTMELVGKHYEDNEDYLRGVGKKAVKSAEKRGEKLGIDPLEMGQKVRQWNMEYLACGPVLVMVLQSAHVIDSVRKLIGSTNPYDADVGTIRADYTVDSFQVADTANRTTRTIIHASDSVESANREISLWFSPEEIFDYEIAIEKILYDTNWSLKSKS